MKRFALTVMRKDDPEVIRRYEKYHANPWRGSLMTHHRGDPSR